MNPALTPPHSADAEQSVLGALMLAPERLSDMTPPLTPDDFYLRTHRLIFRAITELHEIGKRPDAVTLGEWFESNNLSEEIGGASYLIDLANNTPSAANLDAYAEIVRDHALLRQLADVGTEITNSVYASDGSTASDLYIKSLARITSVGARASTTDLPPVDLFNGAAPPAIRHEWLPPAIADFVFEYSEVKGSPPEVLALSALVACSTACHDNIRVQPRANEPGWLESGRLWGMIVGDPSAMKSPPMRLALDPLRFKNIQMVTRYSDAMADYAREAAQFKEADKIRQKAIAKGEGHPEPIQRPERPRNERIIINDATIEKLADLLADNPRGLLYTNDELAGWFASMDIYAKGASGGRDRSYWLRFYDGGDLIIDRMTRETTLVENASMRVLGAIQPERIRALAAKMDDDGLLQRFIVAMIPTAARFPSDKPEPKHLDDRYHALLNQLYATIPDGRTVVRMDIGAQQVQTELMDEVRLMVGTEGLPPMLRSHLAKWPGLFPRLCLVYHMIACAESKKFPTSYPIATNTAKRVAALMRGWVLPSALAFYTNLIGQANPGFELAKQIGNFILGRGVRRVATRDLSQSVNAWRAAPEWRQQAAITCLEQAGWLREAPMTPGQRKPAWTVNDRVHTEFAARAERVRRERERINAVLQAARHSRENENPGA